MTRSVLSLLLLCALAGTAQAASFKYNPKCKAAADGTIEVSAFLATPLLVDSDFRTASLAGSFAPASSSSFTFFGIGDNFAENFRSGFGGGGCVSQLNSSLAGQTSYDFTGEAGMMRASINSLTSQSVAIDRPNPTGPGVAITGATNYEVQQGEPSLLLDVPFIVSGGSGTLTVSQFDFFRQDSSPATQGVAVGSYQIFADANDNCRIDPGETAIAGAAGIVFPNGTFSEPPTSLPIAEGSYVLNLNYFTDVDLAGFSPDCNTSVSLSGNVADGFTLVLRIQ